ncbi:MAG: hypothetical protein OEY07_15810, partial [Gammaproteobacteria bacterium]|nr:hypothetical protein [Gammaproteobacteria bacterium]
INNSKLFIEKAYDTFDTTGFLSWLTSGANTDKAIRFMQTQLSSNWDDFLSELQDIKPLAFQQKYNLKRLFINTKNFDDKQKIFEYRFNKTVDTKEGAVWKDSLLNLIYSQLDSLPDMVTMENEALKGIILRPELKSNKGESLKGVYIWRQNWFYELIDDIGNLIPWTDLMGYQGYIFISEKAANLTDLDIIYHELGHAIDNNLTAEKWYKNRFFYQINWQSWNIDKLESWLTDMDIEHETPLVQERIRDFYSKRINDPTSTTSLNLDGIENTETPILVTAFINSAPNPYQHVQHLPSINGRSYLFGLKDTKLYSFNAELLEFPAFIDRNEPNSYCMHTPFDWFAEQFTCHALGGIVAPWVEEWFYKKFKPGT